MIDNKTLGIYVSSTKTFYYLECGEAVIFNTVDRIKKALHQRNILRINDDGTPVNYQIISYANVKNNMQTYDIQPIYLSKHIENLHKKDNKDGSSTGFFKK